MSTPRRSSTLRSPNATGRGIGAAVACLAWWCLFAGGCSVTVSETSSSDVTGTGEPAPTTMRVATYNIRHGRGTDEVLDLGRTARAIAALDADIVALQEVDEQVGRSGGVDEAATLGRALGMHHAFGSFMDYDGGRYGLAILSRWPIESATTWRLPTGNEPRVALAIDVDPPGIGPCTIVDVHFDWVKDDGFRFAQAEAVAERLATLDRPWILLGDFNDTPGTRTRLLLGGLGIEGHGPEDDSNTWPATAPTVDIDTIIAGPGGTWPPFERRVGSEAVASDHRPVTAEVAPPRRP